MRAFLIKQYERLHNSFAVVGSVVTAGIIICSIIFLILFFKSPDPFKVIAEIPSMFWAVIIGSFFSLGGVWLTNRSNNLQQLTQFKNEREQAKRERELSLMKDIYVDAMEALPVGINCIVKFADMSCPDNQITSDYINKSPAITKVHLIGKHQTVAATVRFTGELVSCYLGLAAKRASLNNLQQKIVMLEKQIADSFKERDQYLQLMKQIKFEDITNDDRWKHASDGFMAESKKASAFMEHCNELRATFLSNHLEFIKECVSESNRVGDLLIPTLLAARKDLEIPLDEERFRKVISAESSKQHAALEAYIDQISHLQQAGRPNST